MYRRSPSKAIALRSRHPIILVTPLFTIRAIPSLQAAAVEARESYKKSIPSKDVVIAAYTGYAGLSF